MSDLPSREDVSEWAALSEVFQGPASLVLKAFAEGRLVDREAFDYEAATLRAAVWVAQVGGNPLPVGAAKDIVAAAIEGTG